MTDRPKNPLIEYPFPVEDGAIVAYLLIPKYLKQSDADRLIAFIKTLVLVSE